MSAIGSLQTKREHNAPDDSYIPVLDGVRGIAIAMVLVFHFWQGSGVYDLPAGVQSVLRLLGIGQKGVDLFFVLSGFLITGILLRTKGAPHYFRNFYARRALRIFPLYYAVLLVCLIGGVALSVPLYAWTKMWWYLLYLQNVAGTFWPTSVAGPEHFWSLAVEEHYYLFWPLVVLLFSRRALVNVCLALILGAVLIRALFIAMGLDVFTFTLCRLDTLALGSLLAIVFTSNWHWTAVVKWTRRLVLPLGCAAFASYFVLSGAGNPIVQTVKYSLFALLCAFALVLALAPHAGNPMPAIASWACLRAMGKTSYAMYVFHPFIYPLVLGRLYRSVWSPLRGMLWPSLILEFVLVVGLTILTSRLSWAAFERPLLKVKDRFRYEPT
jgi:peptidoglycan/LPS O-acetylase OafA/YrhL